MVTREHCTVDDVLGPKWIEGGFLKNEFNDWPMAHFKENQSPRKFTWTLSTSITGQPKLNDYTAQKLE